MSEYKYPDGYTPMTDEELWASWSCSGEVDTDYMETFRGGERHALERIKAQGLVIVPKPDAEPVAWRTVHHAVNTTIAACKAASGRHTSINMYVNSVQITHDIMGTDIADHIVDANKMVSDTAERDALVRRIDEHLFALLNGMDTEESEQILSDIRAHLVGGGE